MARHQRFRIALVGPPRSGKTTSARLILRAVPEARLVSVTAPVRDIADYVYLRMGKQPPSASGVQDGELLRQLRAIILQRQPDFLERAFRAEVDDGERTPVVNDDCRMAMYRAMRELGFVFVWVEARHRHLRPDPGTPEPHDAIVPRDLCDTTLDNTAKVADLETSVARLLRAFGGRA